ncbi:MAG: thioesterase family protein [Candidatus Dormibacteraceae bacterium]
MQEDAFYRRLGGDRFASSPRTAGPWGPDTQHAGPPSALLGRILQECAPRPELRLARITLEIPRPVPVGELEARARVVRSGGRSELLEGEIRAAGVTVMTARAWRIARAPEDTPSLRLDRPAPGVPAAPASPPAMRGAYVLGYMAAMEWRLARGGSFDDPGPGIAWARQRIPLLAGEEDTGPTRALTLADSSWAVGFELDLRRQFAINTDLTLALYRDPLGQWLSLQSATAASAGGSGLARGTMGDERGEVGVVLQTLLVSDRRPGDQRLASD